MSRWQYIISIMVSEMAWCVLYTLIIVWMLSSYSIIPEGMALKFAQSVLMFSASLIAMCLLFTVVLHSPAVSAHVVTIISFGFLFYNLYAYSSIENITNKGAPDTWWSIT